jgi:hypothetical protein
MVMQELKSFSVNPELEFIVIDCISNILNIGKQDHRKEADIWTIINMFTSAMTKAVDEGLIVLCKLMSSTKKLMEHLFYIFRLS